MVTGVPTGDQEVCTVYASEPCFTGVGKTKLSMYRTSGMQSSSSIAWFDGGHTWTYSLLLLSA